MEACDDRLLRKELTSLRHQPVVVEGVGIVVGLGNLERMCVRVSSLVSSCCTTKRRTTTVIVGTILRLLCVHLHSTTKIIVDVNWFLDLLLLLFLVEDVVVVNKLQSA